MTLSEVGLDRAVSKLETMAHMEELMGQMNILEWVADQVLELVVELTHL
jgi:hypothetical protein